MKNKLFHSNLWKRLLVDTKSHGLILFFLFGISGKEVFFEGDLTFHQQQGTCFSQDNREGSTGESQL